MPEVRLMTLNPGHFHAGLIQKEMYPGVAPVVHVYAPLDTDVAEHVQRIARFNTRPEKPTSWQLEVHAGEKPLDRMLAGRPGNVVVLSGRNRGKIDAILACVEAGLHVLADKPWIIEPADLAKLSRALETARRKRVVAYDIMTERYEITSMLQRALVNDPEVFGSPIAGTPEEPGVCMESVHYLLKLVAGVPNLRPAWFFDVREQGEALADVGTHLVDLVQWTLFPEKALDYRSDVRVLAASHWPTVLDPEQFQRVTGQPRSAPLEYYCNTRVTYALRGITTKLDVLWKYQAPPGTGDTHFAVYRGTLANIEVRQRAAENYIPELYAVPNHHASPDWRRAVRDRVTALARDWPGIGLKESGGELQVTIPEAFRIGHEAHFAQVARQFLRYLEDPAAIPSWEESGMLAKYFVSTKGVELSRQSGASSTTPRAGGPGPGADSAR
jgi:predicted dehydrogenase